jgi:SAM-dependent methyltransferase
MLMKDSTVKTLVALNRDFYDAFAADFAESRSKLHDGIIRTLDFLVKERRVGHLLDVGCGSARVGHALGKAPYSHHEVEYSALDFSEDLASSIQRPKRFFTADISQTDWSRTVEAPINGFDAIVSFSVLHHVPGRKNQIEFLKECAGLLSPKGLLVVSLWQLLHVPRLARKIRPWSTLPIDTSELGTHDLLVDWKRGGSGLRYVHQFDLEEVHAIGASAGLTPIDSWRSDGATGDMGLYVIFSK